MLLKKGQISVEVLIIISALILSGIIFTSIFLSQVQSKNKNTETTNDKMNELNNNYKDLDEFDLDFTIDSPNQSSYINGTNINFKITPVSNNGSVICKWVSDISGDFTLATSSCNFNKSNLNAGNHIITIEVRDKYTIKTKQISLRIN